MESEEYSATEATEFPGGLPPEMWQQILGHLVEGHNEQHLAAVANVSRNMRSLVNARSGVRVVVSQEELEQALHDTKEKSKVIIIATSGLHLNYAPATIGERPIVATRFNDIMASAGFLFLMGYGSAITAGGVTFAYENSTVTEVTGGRVDAHDHSTVHKVSAGTVQAEGNARVIQVTDGNVVASDQVTVDEVLAGTVGTRGNATVTRVMGGTVRAGDDSTVVEVIEGTVEASGRAKITEARGGKIKLRRESCVDHAKGNVHIIANDDAQVTVDSDGQDVTVKARGNSKVTCFAGIVHAGVGTTVYAHGNATVVSEGGTIIPHGLEVTILGGDASPGGEYSSDREYEYISDTEYTNSSDEEEGSSGEAETDDDMEWD